ANWFFLFREQSYFETISAPSPFLHFWSLAVEAQFYLVWPVLLIAALRFGGRLSAFALAVSLAAISTLVVASLYSPVADPSRAYYGTDARVAGLLLGAALAIVARPALGGIGGRAMRAGVEASGWMGLAILAFMVTRVSEFDPFIYRGGFFIASTATVGVMLAALHGQNSVAWVLSLPPLRWVGERSYSIYLWHWPVFVLTQPQLSIELRSISLLLARLGMTLILAELSYRLVENRFRRGQGLPRGLWRLPRGVPRRLPQVDLGAGPLWRRAWVRPTGVVAAGLVAVLIAGGLPVRSGLADEMAALEASVTAPPAATADATPEHDPTPDQTVARVIDDIAPLPDDDASGDTAPPPAANEDAPPPASTPAGTPPATATSEATPAISTSPASSISSPGGEDHPDDDADADAETGGEPVEADPTPQATLTPDALGATVTVIGDSVMLGAAPDLAAALPGAVVDAEVGRQFWSAPGVIQALRDREALGDVVVIHLGANGPFTDEQFAAVMEALEGVRAVVFVNVTVPRRWQ
ncbi:MAG: acyltransferase family protein, partial [Dehalococcoidia bacterium]